MRFYFQADNGAIDLYLTPDCGFRVGRLELRGAKYAPHALDVSGGYLELLCGAVSFPTALDEVRDRLWELGIPADFDHATYGSDIKACFFPGEPDDEPRYDPFRHETAS